MDIHVSHNVDFIDPKPIVYDKKEWRPDGYVYSKKTGRRIRKWRFYIDMNNTYEINNKSPISLPAVRAFDLKYVISVMIESERKLKTVNNKRYRLVVESHKKGHVITREIKCQPIDVKDIELNILHVSEYDTQTSYHPNDASVYCDSPRLSYGWSTVKAITLGDVTLDVEGSKTIDHSYVIERHLERAKHALSRHAINLLTAESVRIMRKKFNKDYTIGWASRYETNLVHEIIFFDIDGKRLESMVTFLKHDRVSVTIGDSMRRIDRETYVVI